MPLEKAGLIQRNGNRVRTSFPILLGERRKAYNRLVLGAADRIYGELMPRIRPVVRELERRGWSEWSYHFVWSQIFDSQFVWAEATERKIAPPLSPAIVWVIYPSHPFKSGTNLYPDDELKDPLMAVTWTSQGANTLGWIGGQWRAVYKSALNGAPAGAQAVESLRQIGLAGSDGRVHIPVLRREEALYGQLHQTAHAYLRLIDKRLPVGKLASSIGVNREYAWAMAYHDLSWELLRRMVERGEMKRPAALGPQSSDEKPPPMIGVCSIMPAYAPFVAQIEKALGSSK